MSLNGLQLYVPEMGISSPIVGIMHMSSLACSLVILDSGSAFLKQFAPPPNLLTVLLFLGSPVSILSLLLDFRHTEGKYEISCSFMSHSAPAEWGLSKRLLNMFCI